MLSSHSATWRIKASLVAVLILLLISATVAPVARSPPLPFTMNPGRIYAGVYYTFG